MVGAAVSVVHRVAAWVPTAAACNTYGCSLQHLRLQVLCSYSWSANVVGSKRWLVSFNLSLKLPLRLTLALTLALALTPALTLTLPLPLALALTLTLALTLWAGVITSVP